MLDRIKKCIEIMESDKVTNLEIQQTLNILKELRGDLILKNTK